MPACCAFGCTNRSDREKGTGITFHKFPKDEERRKLWIKSIRRENFIPSKYAVVCSVHFEEKCIDRTSVNIVRLREGAVPTIFASFPSYYQNSGDNARKPPAQREPPPSISNSDKCDASLPNDLAIPSASTSVDTPTKQNLKRALEDKSHKLESCRKKIKMLQQSKRRLIKKNADLKSIVMELRNKKMISDSSVDILERCGGGVGDLLKRKLAKMENKSVPVKYSPEIRSFAMTLHFYSPKAYRYVRKSFDTCLPHPKTISKWYKTVDGSPGFTKSAFTFLSNIVQLSKVAKPFLCNLVMDEMSIRQHVEWDGNKYHGYVDVGTGIDDDNLPVAKEALTFMIVCLNNSWKLPVGYFLLDGLNGEERKNLLNSCIKKLHEVGVEIVSITHDGCPSNMSMLKSLGVIIDSDKIKPYFCHPVTDSPVYVFLDACHMLKLVRNTFAEKKSFCVGNDFIKWDYIELLHKLQEKEGLHLGNKLQASHVQWFKKKMNVKLAAQTLSDSVSSSLEFCLKENIPGFEGCEATIKFLKMFNCLFDILNSRNMKAFGWKSPLSKCNFEATENFLSEVKNYILSMTVSVNGMSLVSSRRKTGFLGFLVCIDSVISIYRRLVMSDDSCMKFLLTYKFSQDHIELFFGKVRSMGGCNNNPTARQFSKAYKQLLTHNEIEEVKRGNCLPLESVPILSVSSRENLSRDVPSGIRINASLSTNRVLLSEEVCESSDISSSSSFDFDVNYDQLSTCSNKIVVYIAGFVAFKLKQRILCEQCSNALVENELSDIHSLIALKNKGGLQIPSSGVIDVCLISEKHFRKYVATVGQDHFHLNRYDCHKLLQSIMKSFVNKPVFSTLFHSHMFDHEGTENHLILLLKAIAEKYIQVRYFYAGKLYSAQLKKKLMCKSRQVLNKFILFTGQ